ncbi:MAG TPA: oligosaccharide flippase family protein [Coriobacteriia bacterium]
MTATSDTPAGTPYTPAGAPASSGRDVRSILRSVAWMTAGGSVNAGLTVVRGLVFANILGPAAYGVWGFLATIQNMSVYTDLGVGQVVARDLPRALASGDRERAGTLMALARVWTSVACLVFGVALVALWPLLRWPQAAGWPVLVPILLCGMGLYTTAGTVEGGSKAFRRLALITTGAGILALAGGVAGSLALGVTGLAISQAVVYGGAGVLAIALRPSMAKLANLGHAWRTAVREGWRLLLPSLGLQVFVSVDVLIVAWAFQPSALGLYSVALLGSGLVAGVLASGVASVVGPHLLGETAAADADAPSAMVWGPAAALAWVLAPACAIAAFLTPLVLVLLLPKYAAAATPAVVLLAAAYCLHSQFGFSKTFVAIGRPAATLPLYAVLTPLNVAVDILLIRQGLGLLAVAAGSLVVNALFLLSHEVLVAYRVSRGRRQYAQMAATLAAAGLPVAAAASVLGYTALAWGAAALGLAGWFGLTFVAWRWLGPRFTLRARPGAL